MTPSIISSIQQPALSLLMPGRLCLLCWHCMQNLSGVSFNLGCVILLLDCSTLLLLLLLRQRLHLLQVLLLLLLLLKCSVWLPRLRTERLRLYGSL